MHNLYEKYLETLNDAGKYRELPKPEQRDLLDFSSNDYLNLRNDPEILQAGMEAAREYGIGASGSRLLSGNKMLFELFETRIAQDKNMDAALIFSSGFQANISCLSSLLDSKILGNKAIVFFDRLNHASLYYGVFLSDAELVRYQHNDMIHLENMLNKHRNDRRPKFIVTESIFGMDGDLADLESILSFAKKHRAFLYLDEAHATGLFGRHGYGLSTNLDFTGVNCAVMGTFSKALGCSGGYIACDQLIRNYLVNRSPGFIYSTAPSPAVIGAAFKSWQMIKSLQEKRDKLLSLSKILIDELLEMGLDIGASATHILPVILKHEKIAIHVKDKLFEDGIVVSCIRPPTVPIKTSRLRIALTTQHSEHDVQELVYKLRKIL